MADSSFSAADERAHPPGRDPAWEESWYFDFVDEDRGVAGYARLALRPGDRTAQGGGAQIGRAWWWAAVVGPDVPYVLVREHDVDLPRPGSLEVRASGLWAEPVCETPFEHWSVGMEAFGVAFDDPTEAYRTERGDVVGLGFDLEWEAEVTRTAGPQRYEQSCSVHGIVLVGRDRFEVSGTGIRAHEWGPKDWWGETDEPGLALDERGLLVAAELHAPLQVPAPDGRVSRLARGVCDGAWAERLQPASRVTG